MSVELIDQIPSIFIFHNPLLFRAGAFLKLRSDYHLTAFVQTVYKESFSVLFTKAQLLSAIPSHHLSEL